MKACPHCHTRYPTDAVYCFVDGSELARVRDPLLGATLGGRYLIEDVIGVGGMATVYRARQQLVERTCAIKVLSQGFAGDATVRERFRREAKSAQVLAHPNVITIFDHGETSEGTPYLVMELLRGETLSDVVGDGPLPPPRAIPLMVQMARGIARAHDLGVVHRDLKPDNIFVCTRQDGSDLVKILDFGIARTRGDPRLTGAGELFGTPQYLAPERISAGDTGPSVDLYALGVLFFEMATGRLPFDANDATTFLVKHMTEAAPRARAFVPSVPEALDTLIASLLEKSPKARPVDAHRVLAELLALARSLGIELPPEPEEDPASREVPARATPSLGVRPWTRRIDLFRQMLRRSASDPSPRSLELQPLLVELERCRASASEVQAATEREQQKLEEVDLRGREGRQRFGFAVDALGKDASRAKADARGRREALAEAVVTTSRKNAAYLAAQREVIVWEGRSAGEQPYPQLAQAHLACAAAVDAWLVAHRQRQLAQSAVEERERALEDLEYQISELRAALGKHELAIDGEREAAQSRLLALSKHAEELEAELVRLATRFCEPLRSRPELGSFFQELEVTSPG